MRDKKNNKTCAIILLALCKSSKENSLRRRFKSEWLDRTFKESRSYIYDYTIFDSNKTSFAISHLRASNWFHRFHFLVRYKECDAYNWHSELDTSITLHIDKSRQIKIQLEIETLRRTTSAMRIENININLIYFANEHVSSKMQFKSNIFESLRKRELSWALQYTIERQYQEISIWNLIIQRRWQIAKLIIRFDDDDETS